MRHVETYYSNEWAARWLWILAGAIAFAFFCIVPATAESYEDGLAARLRGDYATAFEIWRPLAERGDPGAENGLGVLYSNGEGVARDEAEALKWFQLSAAQRYAKAEYNLGLHYEQGRGVDRDYARAMKYYSLAADQGLAAAQFAVGRYFYDGGLGFAADYPRAVKYFRRAADQGFYVAQDFLARMYEFGFGVPADRVAAYSWLIVASKTATDTWWRDEIARDLNRLGKKMTPNQREQSNALAERCLRSQYRDCDLH